MWWLQSFKLIWCLRKNGIPRGYGVGNGLQLLHILHIPHCELIYAGSLDLLTYLGVLDYSKLTPELGFIFINGLCCCFGNISMYRISVGEIFLICQTFWLISFVIFCLEKFLALLASLSVNFCLCTYVGMQYHLAIKSNNSLSLQR